MARRSPPTRERPTLGAAAAVSTFNSGPYIIEMLDSIVAQTVLPQQIVVGDDGSTDGTPEAVRRYVAGLDGPAAQIDWVLLDSVDLGLRPNMERIIRSCDADVIVVCDHDDICRPTRFEWALDRFESDAGLLFVHGDADRIDGEGRVLAGGLMRTQMFDDAERTAYENKRAFEVLIRRNLAQGATAAFRRKLVEIAEPVPNVWIYDAWYAIVAAALGGAGIDERKVLSYRQHSSNSSGVRRRTNVEKIRMLTANGNGRNHRQLMRARHLALRVRALGDAGVPEACELAERWLRHEQTRSSYPTNRLVRWLPVCREARTGIYGAVARGRKDVLLDLVQSRRPDIAEGERPGA